MRTRLVSVATLELLLSALALPAAAQDTGREVYARHCSWCHGDGGRGDGPAANGMFPRPRDFVRADYKIRSTSHGQLPTDEDLFAVISRGLPGTPMPGWEKILTANERSAVVSYLKSLSPRFTTEARDTLIAPAEPASVERGRRIYREAKCFLCHGDAGRGNGPITTTLYFEWGLPHTARDFTRGWTFKGGHEPRDIYLRITGGLNGTPMGPYQHLLSDQDRWDLAHYVASLDEEPAETSEDFVVVAANISGEIPAGHDSSEWQKARPVVVPLAGQVVRDPPLRWWTPTAGSVTVRSVWNRREVGFLVEWNDPTRASDAFPDSVLLQFPFQDGSKPYFLFGGASDPVRVWRWQSGNTTEEWTAAGSANIEPEAAEFWANAEWEEGRWHVVFRRSLQGVPRFLVGKFVPILFSVLDGANAEIGNVRAISTWLYTTLEEPTSLRPWLLGLAYFLGAATVEAWILSRLRT